MRTLWIAAVYSFVFGTLAASCAAHAATYFGIGDGRREWSLPDGAAGFLIVASVLAPLAASSLGEGPEDGVPPGHTTWAWVAAIALVLLGTGSYLYWRTGDEYVARRPDGSVVLPRRGSAEVLHQLTPEEARWREAHALRSMSGLWVGLSAGAALRVALRRRPPRDLGESSRTETAVAA